MKSCKKLFFMLFILYPLVSCSNPFEDNLPQQENQIFTFSADGFDPQTEGVPKLIVQLGILTQTNSNGQKERFGRAVFSWTDLSDANGGSTLTGVATIRLHKVNDWNILVETIDTPISSNRDFYSQVGYTGHHATTPLSLSTGALCVEISDWDLVTSKGLSFTQNQAISYCQSITVSGADLSLKLESNSSTSIPLAATKPLVLAVQNLGPRPSISPVLTLLIPSNLQFIRDDSGKFNCSESVIGVVECMIIASGNLGVGSQGLGILFKAKSLGVQTVSVILNSQTADINSLNNSIEFPVEVSSENIFPTVVLSSNDTWITEEDIISLRAKTLDNAGVARVEIYDGDILLESYDNTSLTPSFMVTHRLSVSLANNGLHTYTAKVYDVSNNIAMSQPVKISITIGDDLQCEIQSSSPNIIFILSDDQAYMDLAFMPLVQQYLISSGTSFTNAFVAEPMCCPSRASILRGQYPHNHGVKINVQPLGGFPTFYNLGRETSTLATWLQDAGYYTALMGKYLNHYPGRSRSTKVVEETYIPPGWSEWATLIYNQKYYDYQLNKNGFIRSYGASESDYQVDVMSRMAVGFIKRKACNNQPFFLYLAPTVPHTPLISAERHKSLFNNAQVPRDASFNEQDVSEKPSFYAALPLLTTSQINNLDIEYKNRLQMLQSLDEMIASLVTTLEVKGVLENTYIIFTSDHGYHLGQHRLTAGKNTPYEEDIQVPFIIRGPGVLPNHTLDDLVLNLDIAPTFTEIAGTTAPSFVDGKSLLTLLSGNNANWRQSILVEGYTSSLQPKYVSLRTKTQKYTEWYANGSIPLSLTEYEFYDLQIDPLELENTYNIIDETLLQTFRTQLEILKQCQGNTCP